MDTGTEIAKTRLKTGSWQQCGLVSSNMAGGRLFPIALAPDPEGL